jgi:lactam utilization protein B
LSAVHEVKVLLGIDAPAGVVPREMLAWADTVNLPPVGESAEVARLLAQEGLETGVLVGLADGSGDPAGILQREVGAMRVVLGGCGGRLAQVKLCGHLERSCEEDSAAAEACVDWMYAEAAGVYLVVGAGGLLHAVAEARGVPLRREIVADRVYQSEAQLAPLHGGEVTSVEVEDAVQRIRSWKQTEVLRLAGGGDWLVEAELVSLSADRPGSADLARGLRGVLD